MSKSFVNLTLNAHLPYIRPLEDERFLEEDWYYEAVVESYLPLVRMFNKLIKDNVSFRITLVLSPSLVEMMKDRFLTDRLLEYIDSHIELGEKELKRLKNEPKVYKVAEEILEMYKLAKKEIEEEYNYNILSPFQTLNEDQKIEIITTASTYAFLPLYESKPSLLTSSFVTAMKVHFDNFKGYPSGLWLPECGYFPTLDAILKKDVLESKYFTLSSTAFSFSESYPKRGNYAPVKTPSGLYAFALDGALMSFVNSSLTGYPGDDDYREFYRDIGYDLPRNYVGKYLHNKEHGGFTGYKYYAVSGKKAEKDIYERDKAMYKVKLHSENFISNIIEKKNKVQPLIDRPPIFNLAFDAELFGHWWKEGVDWLESVLRLIDKSDELKTVTGSDYIKEYPEAEVFSPTFSSLADGTYSYPYLDGNNNKIQRLIFNALDKVQDLTTRFRTEINSVKLRYLNQAVRDALLLCASDWPKILHNNSCPSYAEKRINEHLTNIDKICELLSHNKLETSWLVKAERHYPVFEGIDFKVFTLD